MSRWYPKIVTIMDAVIATRIGLCGALAFAAWLGFPLGIKVVSSDNANQDVSAVETFIAVILIQFSVCAALRFGSLRGRIVGSILIVILLVEVAKRVILTAYGIGTFGAFEACLATAILVGLLHGTRGATALRNVLPEERTKRDELNDKDLKDVFK
jgi:hypothetical protein